MHKLTYTCAVILVSGCAVQIPAAPSVSPAAPQSATPAGVEQSATVANDPAAAPSPASVIAGQATKTPQQIAKEAFGSVVLLVMRDETGKEVSQGSGFFVKEGVIATNFHVIDGAKSGYAKLVGKDGLMEIQGVAAYDASKDLALLAVGSTAPVMQLAPLDSISVADAAYAVGNPKGLEGTFSEGLVSAIRKDQSGTVIQISTPISPGSSGGPILNNKGEVIGVATAGITDGQNLNFAMPALYVQRLIEEATNPVSLALVPSTRPPKNAPAPSVPSSPSGGGRTINGVKFQAAISTNWSLNTNESDRMVFFRRGSNVAMVTITEKPARFATASEMAASFVRYLGSRFVKSETFNAPVFSGVMVIYSEVSNSGTPLTCLDYMTIQSGREWIVSVWADQNSPDIKAIDEEVFSLIQSWQWK